jgi:hypothetical protein
MNTRLARALVRLYPRQWRERYGAEFAALLEEGSGGLGTALDVMISALGERISPIKGGVMTAETSRLEMWTERAPWMVFGLAPLGLLAAAYGLCLFILWSGWRMLLPSEQTPFVPVDGWALFYFGAGRFLYFWAPMVVCCAIACIAARPGVKALWPMAGMALIAVIGATVHVRASRPSLSEPGHVSMALTLWRPQHAAEMLLVSAVVHGLLRMRMRRVRAPYVG